MPGYYHDYLEQKYPGEFPDPKAAFLSVDGISDFPELVLLMRQIQTFQGTGIAAHLFYESKVAEAISLIIEKTKEHKGFVPSGDLTKEDLVNLDAVKCYIEDHCAFDIRTDQLTKIACMGQTKLRYSFKKALWLHNYRIYPKQTGCSCGIHVDENGFYGQPDCGSCRLSSFWTVCKPISEEYGAIP